MKKLSLFCALVLTLVLTGCSNKELRCTYRTTDSFQGESSVGYKVIFDKDDKPTSIAISSQSKYADKYLETVDIDTEFAAAKEYCTELETVKGVKCDANLTGKTIFLNVKYDIKKISNEGLNLLNLGQINTVDYDTFKKQYESYGFTCK